MVTRARLTSFTLLGRTEPSLKPHPQAEDPVRRPSTGTSRLSLSTWSQIDTHAPTPDTVGGVPPPPPHDSRKPVDLAISSLADTGLGAQLIRASPPAGGNRMDTVLHTDPQEQLRSLYKSLLNRQENLDEFRQLLSEYPPVADDVDTEPLAAIEVRTRLSQRIREWTGQPFGGLSASQMHMWRAIVIDRRMALAPWGN